MEQTKIFFFPVGNADTILINTSDNKVILMDYFKPQDSETEEENSGFNVSKFIHKYLNENDIESIDLAVFSHADDDHVHGFEELFWLEHAKTYQSDERIKVEEIHVPAILVTEANPKGSAKILRQEIRYRLKNNLGAKFYGYPPQVKEWLEDAEITIGDLEDICVHAGEFIPGFDSGKGALEIFVHSPFSDKQEQDDQNRNDNSIVLHLTAIDVAEPLRVMLGGDAGHQEWADIVTRTQNNDNTDRLEYDVFKVSHHCSFHSLSDEKGDTETIPRDEVKELFGYGKPNCILISSSNPITDEDTVLPPHFQAAAYYKKVVKGNGESEDNFMVTMEYPNPENPVPIILSASEDGFQTESREQLSSTVHTYTQRSSPRVG